MEDIVVDQTPPEGFEPQPDLQPGQSPDGVSRPSDLIADAEAEEQNVSEDDGVADSDDDAVESDSPDDPVH